MSNIIWSDLVAAFKAGEVDVDNFINQVESKLDSELKGLPGLLSQLVSADANILITDAKSDLEQIVTNIQNNYKGLTKFTFAPLFQAAAQELPVIAAQGLQLLENDWTIITAYYSAQSNQTTIPVNNGVLANGIQTGG